jgi:hypothetical protein
MIKICAKKRRNIHFKSNKNIVIMTLNSRGALLVNESESYEHYSQINIFLSDHCSKKN